MPLAPPPGVSAPNTSPPSIPPLPGCSPTCHALEPRFFRTHRRAGPHFPRPHRHHHAHRTPTYRRPVRRELPAAQHERRDVGSRDSAGGGAQAGGQGSVSRRGRHRAHAAPPRPVAQGARASRQRPGQQPLPAQEADFDQTAEYESDATARRAAPPPPAGPRPNPLMLRHAPGVSPPPSERGHDPYAAPARGTAPRRSEPYLARARSERVARSGDSAAPRGPRRTLPSRSRQAVAEAPVGPTAEPAKPRRFCEAGLQSGFATGLHGHGAPTMVPRARLPFRFS